MARLNQEYDEARKTLDSLTNQIKEANEYNTKLEEDKHQYQLALECFKNETDSQFYLSK